MSNKGIPLIATAALMLAACSGQKAMDEQMRQDLEAASASSFELAPAGGGQKVVSAIEQTRRAQPAERASHGPSQGETPSKSANPQARDSAVPQTADGPAATKPLPKSSVSAPPPGGYKTMDEVLRKAPFPIKP
jgi:hypothetical protein